MQALLLVAAALSRLSGAATSVLEVLDCKSAVDNIPPGYEWNQLYLDGWQQCIVEIEYTAVDQKPEYTNWATNQAWACGYFPAGSVTAPPNQIRIWKKTYNWCVGVGGDASILPKIELAEGLLGILGVTTGLGGDFGVNGHFSYCESTEYQVNYAPAQSQCWSSHARVEWIESSVTGICHEIESRFTWTPKFPPNAPPIFVDCGVVESVGDAYDRTADIIQHAPKTADCDVYPGTPLMFPDPWDGKRMEPCCAPLPGCDSDATPPCCGVYGGQ